MPASPFDREQLQKIYEENKTLSASHLLTRARRRGLDVTMTDVKNVLSAFANPREKYAIPRQDGKNFARHVHEEYKVDLMDRSKKPSREGYRYILVAVDSFSREMWVEPLRRKVPEETAAAFSKILDRAPAPAKVLVDQGSEWSGRFADYLEEEGVALQDKYVGDYGSFAVLDRAIRTLKGLLALREDEGKDWGEALQLACRQYNDKPNLTTGVAPDDVEGSDAAQFFISKQMSQNMQHNMRIQAAREDSIREAGVYRTQLPKPKLGWREGMPRFGPPTTLHPTERYRFQFGRVHDESRQSVPTKRAIPSRGD